MIGSCGELRKFARSLVLRLLISMDTVCGIVESFNNIVRVEFRGAIEELNERRVAGRCVLGSDFASQTSNSTSSSWFICLKAFSSSKLNWVAPHRSVLRWHATFISQSCRLVALARNLWHYLSEIIRFSQPWITRLSAYMLPLRLAFRPPRGAACVCRIP